MTRSPRRRRRLRGDGAEATTQLVLLVPVLLLLVLGVVQGALVWHAAHLADAAASRGAHVAARAAAGAPAGVTAAQAFAAEAGARLSGTPRVERTATAASATVVIEVTRVLPLFPGSVTRTATAPVERYVPEPER